MNTYTIVTKNFNKKVELTDELLEQLLTELNNQKKHYTVFDKNGLVTLR